MDGGTLQFMESRFGQDFTAVRIHTDSRAAESASAIQARAYTSGHNIVFGADEYQPTSDHGKRLLAHELVHVGQQRGETIKKQGLSNPPEGRRTPEIRRKVMDSTGPTTYRKQSAGFLQRQWTSAPNTGAQRVAIRNVRRESIQKVDTGKKAGDVPEDDAKKSTERLDNLTKKYEKDIDAMLAAKTKEVEQV